MLQKCDLKNEKTGKKSLSLIDIFLLLGKRKPEGPESLPFS